MNIKEKDSQVTKSGNVKFFSAGDYLFDTYDNYSGKTGYAERFPSIGEGDYRPAYACAESNTKIEIKAEPYANITFKNERGVPSVRRRLLPTSYQIAKLQPCKKLKIESHEYRI